MPIEQVNVFEIEKFDETHNWYWKMQIEDYLHGKRINLPFLLNKVDNMEDTNWNLLDQ